MQERLFELSGNPKWSTIGNMLLGTEAPSMGNAGLPFELLMHTMKFVETREELQDCSLVSQAWRVAAQGEIFSTITIRSEWECRFWKNKFAQSPHLAGFVRNLRLRDSKCHGNDQVKPPQYLAADAAPELLAQLTHVRSLSLDSFHLWGPVERGLALQFRCLKSLELYNISLQESPDLLDLILSLPQLSRLTMGRAPGKGIQSTLLDLGATVENGKRLRSLRPRINIPQRLHFLCLHDVEACLDMLMWLTSEAFDLSQIQELCLSWLCFGDDVFEVSLPADYFTALDDLINIVGSHVRVLHLGMPIYTEDEAGQAFTSNDYDAVCSKPSRFELSTITDKSFRAVHLAKSKILSQLTALRTVTLSYVDFDDCQDTLPVALQAAVSLLSTLSAPMLREISLEEVDIKVAPSRRIGDIGTLPEWQKLDDLVSGTAFPLLREVNISLSIICRTWESHDTGVAATDSPLDGTVNPEQMELILSTCMPKAASRGLLSLDMYVGESTK
ncbi:hypothetical protein Moror_3847 [Moniliophthora roreri MCA 2997]|uniref:F-box domain-containing protein n=2 Tax=Moniliophthora roreri TaxID=221103 RepID=V2YUQ0_MONRO|nr:hypothetical protein Moror_3847 [Moniliophthora roreri MCA 2997]